MSKGIYSNSEDNAAFERCADLMAALMIKYGPRVIEKKKKRFLRMFSDIDTQSPPEKEFRLRYLQRYSVLPGHSANKNNDIF